MYAALAGYANAEDKLRILNLFRQHNLVEKNKKNYLNLCVFLGLNHCVENLIQDVDILELKIGDENLSLIDYALIMNDPLLFSLLINDCYLVGWILDILDKRKYLFKPLIKDYFPKKSIIKNFLDKEMCKKVNAEAIADALDTYLYDSSKPYQHHEKIFQKS
jgi:hypothetical protein